MTQFYVYVYRDPSRGNEPIYVGKGFKGRAYVHLTRKDKHEFVHRLAKMKANGTEPTINIVGLPSEALAIQCEVDTIARFGRKDLGLGPLLNMTDGSEGASGVIQTLESNRKRSVALKGKPKSIESNRKRSVANKGKSPSPETCKNISAGRKGKFAPMLTCPHCGKVGRANGLKQWHFDKCKFKIPVST